MFCWEALDFAVSQVVLLCTERFSQDATFIIAVFSPVVRKCFTHSRVIYDRLICVFLLICCICVFAFYSPYCSFYVYRIYLP